MTDRRKLRGVLQHKHTITSYSGNYYFFLPNGPLAGVRFSTRVFFLGGGVGDEGQIVSCIEEVAEKGGDGSQGKGKGRSIM